MGCGGAGYVGEGIGGQGMGGRLGDRACRPSMWAQGMGAGRRGCGMGGGGQGPGGWGGAQHRMQRCGVGCGSGVMVRTHGL